MCSGCLDSCNRWNLFVFFFTLHLIVFEFCVRMHLLFTFFGSIACVCVCMSNGVNNSVLRLLVYFLLLSSFPSFLLFVFPLFFGNLLVGAYMRPRPSTERFTAWPLRPFPASFILFILIMTKLFFESCRAFSGTSSSPGCRDDSGIFLKLNETGRGILA